MPDFGFLQDPGQFRDDTASPPRYQTWGWETIHPQSPRKDDLFNYVVALYWPKSEKIFGPPGKEYWLACLTNDALYVTGAGYSELKDRIKATAALKTHEPDAVFQTYRRYPLADIHKLRYFDAAGRLDLIDYVDKFDTIEESRARTTRDIFEALRLKLAPAAPIQTERLQGWRSWLGPGGCLFAAFVFLLLTTRFWIPGKARRPLRGGWYLSLLQDLYDTVGETTVNVVAIALLAAAGAWVVRRYLRPLTNQIVTVREPR